MNPRHGLAPRGVTLYPLYQTAIVVMRSPSFSGAYVLSTIMRRICVRAPPRNAVISDRFCACLTPLTIAPIERDVRYRFARRDTEIANFATLCDISRSDPKRSNATITVGQTRFVIFLSYFYETRGKITKRNVSRRFRFHCSSHDKHINKHFAKLPFRCEHIPDSPATYYGYNSENIGELTAQSGVALCRVDRRCVNCK